MSEDCKHCNSHFPSMVQSIRESLRMTKDRIVADMLRCEEDKGFEEVLSAKYCCRSAQYDAEDAYDEYFPYRGIHKIELLIQDLYDITSNLNEAFGDDSLTGTAEKFLAVSSCDGKIAQDMQDLNFNYERLIKLCWNVQKALKRETDSEKRTLLDGRNR